MNYNSWISIVNFSLFHIYFPLLWLFYFTRWLKTKNLGSIFKTSSISYLIIVLATVGFGSFLLFISWSKHPVNLYLLPPYSNYFYLVIFKTLITYLIGVIIGLALYFLLRLVIKIAKVKFVDYKELELLALGAVLVGWNNIIVYICLIVVLMMISSIFISFFKEGRKKRVILTPHIFLSLIIILLLGYQISHLLGLY